MARKLRALALSDFRQLPLVCSSCVFWESAGERRRNCGAVCDADLQEAWYRQVTDEWGECGRVAREDEEVLGFIKYAPSGYFPQASTFASAPQDPTIPLISCLHIAPDARHHGLGSVLLRAALKDLIGRGERKVEAFAAAKPENVDDSPMMSLDFLSSSGFSVVRPDPHYPLMRLDLRSIVSWTENLETVLNSLRFPTRVPSRTPASWTDGQR